VSLHLAVTSKTLRSALPLGSALNRPFTVNQWWSLDTRSREVSRDPFFGVSVSKVSGLGLEGFRSRSLSLETLHRLFFAKFCKKEFLKRTVLKTDCSKFNRVADKKLSTTNKTLHLKRKNTFQAWSNRNKAGETSKEKLKPTKREPRDGNVSFSNSMMIQTNWPWQTMETWSRHGTSHDRGVN